MVEYDDPGRRDERSADPPAAASTVTTPAPAGAARSPVVEIVVLVVAGGALLVSAWWQVAMFGEGLGLMWAVQLLYPLINVAAVAALVSLVVRRLLHRQQEAHAQRLAAVHAELAALREAVAGPPRG